MIHIDCILITTAHSVTQAHARFPSTSKFFLALKTYVSLIYIDKSQCIKNFVWTWIIHHIYDL